MALFFIPRLLLVGAYLFLHRLGELLVSLVLVQSTNSYVASLSFASALSFSVLLLSLTLVNSAYNSNALTQRVVSSFFGDGKEGDPAFQFMLGSFQFCLSILLLCTVALFPLFVVYSVVKGLLFQKKIDGAGNGKGSGGRLRRFLLFTFLIVVGVLWVYVKFIRGSDNSDWVNSVKNAATRTSKKSEAILKKSVHFSEPPSSFSSLSYILAIVSANVGVIGVAVMGLLSGYAGITSPLQAIVPFLYWRGKVDRLRQSAHTLARRQRYVLGMYSKSQRSAAQQHYEHAASRNREGREGGDGEQPHAEKNKKGLLGWVQRAWRGSGEVSLASLYAEAEATQYLGISLSLQSSELQGVIAEAERGGTLLGLLNFLWGAALLVYTVVKIVFTAYSLYAARQSEENIVYQLIARWGGEGTGIILLVPMLVNAWLVCMSIRSLLLLFFQVTLSLGSAVVTADTTAVLLALCMSVYSIGLLVMLRQSLPDVTEGLSENPNAHHVSHVLLTTFGHLPVYYYQRLNEWCFMIGCGVTIVARKFFFGDPASMAIKTASE
ncbi:The Golgi pH Regulator (GPHR) Family N-terminal/Abscisic acid G-protein coupled receptor, putative [Angomonas deanei]|uniref:The Golgi pH Regulator (GPHR) Family N-terminal/Abscisic acid G-protein coupled receptor, putative n=1 Tax=Angomonas deanei TaxID=59799 RepID=A0A7G2CQM7_9TRYP|nr:The Golgi pH Regulator (GPHR) Family N-terminal/Abscisic acid G-protein coupled receptor, putative [Angomonas deanei]